jgi:RNAse (barnase) inhibitor barstar
MSDLANELADPVKGGVYRLRHDPLVIERDAKAAGLAVYRIGLRHVRDKTGVMRRIATALRFPAYFGGNLDALNDCLMDLAWLMEGDKLRRGFVLVFEDANDFATAHPQDFEDWLAVMRSAAEYWRGTAKPFWVFLHTPGDWNSSLPDWPAR